MLDHQTWLLFIKKLSGDCTAQELSDLNDRLSGSPLLHQHLVSIEQIWNDRKLKNQSSHIEADQEYERLLAKLHQLNDWDVLPMQDESASADDRNRVPFSAKYRRAILATVGVAAIALLVILAGGIPFSERQKKSRGLKSNEVATRSGSRSQLKLPDGTLVWLNGDSRLAYAEDFGKQTREVRLTGEAYFDVASDKKRPFLIQTETMQIKVTGTAFNVRSYPNEAVSETSLIHGKVEITLNEDPEKIYYLLPREKLVVANNISKSSKAHDQAVVESSFAKGAVSPALPSIQKLHVKELNDLPVETAWVNNKLVFDNESFRQVANKMEHWFGVKVEFENPALEKIYFTGIFENETLPEALEAMQYTADFRFHVQPGLVRIYE